MIFFKSKGIIRDKFCRVPFHVLFLLVLCGSVYHALTPRSFMQAIIYKILLLAVGTGIKPWEYQGRRLQGLALEKIKASVKER